MSRSHNTELHNPSVRNFEWNGESGGFRYFDKSLGEKGERVQVDLPFRFLALDCLNTIRGYDDRNQSGYWANEVRNIKTDKLIVRNKKGVVFEGLYADLRETGTKYCQSVYIAFYKDDKLVIGNLALTGAALSAWIDFRKKAKIYEGAIQVKEMIEGRKGKTVYQTPVFQMITVKEETEQQAIELDKELQEYLKAYFERMGQIEVKVEKDETTNEPPESDTFDEEKIAEDKDNLDLPF